MFIFIHIFFYVYLATKDAFLPLKRYNLSEIVRLIEQTFFKRQVENCAKISLWNKNLKGCVYLENKVTTPKKHGIISYIALLIGIICFFIVFVTPTRIANVGNLVGDYITFFLTGTGITLSIIGIAKKTEKKIIPVISLIFSLSFFIFWIITLILLFTGQIEFGP